VTTDANAPGQPINIHKNFVTLLPQVGEKTTQSPSKVVSPSRTHSKIYSKSKNEMGKKRRAQSTYLNDSAVHVVGTQSSEGSESTALNWSRKSWHGRRFRGWFERDREGSRML